MLNRRVVASMAMLMPGLAVAEHSWKTEFIARGSQISTENKTTYIQGEENYSKYSIDRARIGFRGDVSSTLSYNFRLRFEESKYATTAANGQSLAFDKAYIDHKPFKNLTLRLGRMTPVAGGGWDYYYLSDKDLDGLSRGAGVSVKYGLGAHDLHLSILNNFGDNKVMVDLTTPADTSVEVRTDDPLIGLSYEGSFGPASVRASYWMQNLPAIRPVGSTDVIQTKSVTQTYYSLAARAEIAGVNVAAATQSMTTPAKLYLHTEATGGLDVPGEKDIVNSSTSFELAYTVGQITPVFMYFTEEVNSIAGRDSAGALTYKDNIRTGYSAAVQFAPKSDGITYFLLYKNLTESVELPSGTNPDDEITTTMSVGFTSMISSASK